jgi:outer membrane receptor protein involved in Fe transport
MRTIACFFLTCVLFGMVLFAAAAQTPSSASAAISGTVTDAIGAPLAGAAVELRGPQTYRATTDAAGSFSLGAVPPGVYIMTASKPGYQTARQPDFVVLSGQSQTVTIRLNAATLTSLRTIATVRTSAGSQFNTTPASVTVVNSAIFQDQGTPQVTRVLNQIPGVQISLPATSANGAAPGSITVPTIRGAASYETATLIDGHPLATQSFGDYVTTFLSSYMFESAEVVKGPGADALAVNNAINGTINFRTKDPTLTPTPDYTVGVDNRGGTFGNIGISGTVGKLGLVVDVANINDPSALNGKRVLFDPSNAFLTPSFSGPTISGTPSFSNVDGTVSNIQTGYSLLACCYTLQGDYENTSELVKFRYHLSGSTTATVSYLGGQSYSDENGDTGNMTLAQFNPGTGYTGSLKPGAQQVMFVFPGAPNRETNNEPIFQAEVSSTLGNDTFVLRYYHASIYRQVLQGTNGNILDSYPATLFGQDSNGNFYNGASTPLYFSDYFDETESDKLEGWSFEYNHPIGQNTLTFAVDQQGDNSLDYEAEPTFNNVFLPQGSGALYTTLQLRANVALAPKLQATAVDYYNIYRSTYATSCPFAFGFSECNIDGSNVGFTTKTTNHNDPRLGLVFQPDPNLALRFSAGSAISPPYLDLLTQITSPPTYNTSNGIVTVTKPGNVKPETAFGYDLGADYRLFDGQTILSADLYENNLFNHFFGLTTNSGLVCAANQCFSTGGTAAPAGTPIFYSFPTNISNFRFEGVELSLRRNPPVGLGFNLSGALQRGYVYNLPPFFYCSNAGPGCTPYQNLNIIDGENLNGEGIGEIFPSAASFSSTVGALNTRIPYAQGNVAVSYAFKDGIYALVGETYYGHNNQLNEPPFGIGYATIRVPVTSTVSFQVSGDNIFNAWPGVVPIYGGGIAIPLANGQTAATVGNVLGPATYTFQFTKRLP